MPMFTTRPELRGSFGMAASTHWLATGVAMSVLERGGNAFDAAVAAGFTLQVVEPHLNGPAGEVPIIFQAAGGTPTVVCGQGPAPAAATPDAFAGLDRIPGSGVLPACVPGAFDAWLLLARDHGTLPLRDLLEPAIGTPAAATPSPRTSSATSPPSSRSSPGTGPPRPRCGCPAARRPPPTPSTPTRRSPTPTSASSPRPRRRGAPASSASTRRGGSGARDSSPRPSRSSARSRAPTARASRAGPC